MEPSPAATHIFTESQNTSVLSSNLSSQSCDTSVLTSNLISQSQDGSVLSSDLFLQSCNPSMLSSNLVTQSWKTSVLNSGPFSRIQNASAFTSTLIPQSWTTSMLSSNPVTQDQDVSSSNSCVHKSRKRPADMPLNNCMDNASTASRIKRPWENEIGNVSAETPENQFVEDCNKHLCQSLSSQIQKEPDDKYQSLSDQIQKGPGNRHLYQSSLSQVQKEPNNSEYLCQSLSSQTQKRPNNNEYLCQSLSSQIQKGPNSNDYLCQSLSGQIQKEHIALMESFYTFSCCSYIHRMWVDTIKHSYLYHSGILEGSRQAMLHSNSEVPDVVNVRFNNQWKQLIADTRYAVLVLKSQAEDMAGVTEKAHIYGTVPEKLCPVREKCDITGVNAKSSTETAGIVVENDLNTGLTSSQEPRPQVKKSDIDGMKSYSERMTELTSSKVQNDTSTGLILSQELQKKLEDKKEEQMKEFEEGTVHPSDHVECFEQDPDIEECCDQGYVSMLPSPCPQNEVTAHQIQSKNTEQEVNLQEPGLVETKRNREEGPSSHQWSLASDISDGMEGTTTIKNQPQPLPLNFESTLPIYSSTQRTPSYFLYPHVPSGLLSHQAHYGSSSTILATTSSVSKNQPWPLPLNSTSSQLSSCILPPSVPPSFPISYSVSSIHSPHPSHLTYTTSSTTASPTAVNEYFRNGSREVLEKWYQQHKDWPYATEAESAQLAALAGLSRTQVMKWLSNRRYRSANTNRGGHRRRGSTDSSQSEPTVTAIRERLHYRRSSWQL